MGIALHAVFLKSIRGRTIEDYVDGERQLQLNGQLRNIGRKSMTMIGAENTKKMADYLNNEYLSKNPEFDVMPTGKVDWTTNTYVSRCGANRFGRVEQGYCGKTYRFRSCWVLGAEMRAHVCTRCDLRRSIVTEPLGRKKDLCKRLATLIGCSPAEAFHQSYASFGYLAKLRKPNLYPMEEDLEKVIEFGYDQTTRLPYSD